jgi:integrase
MSNVLYGNELFNNEIKQEFLQEGYKETTQKTISRVFKVSNLMEKDLNKDLFLFSREEIRNFLFTLRPSKVSASKQNGNLVGSYITWAIEKGYKKGLNPLDSVAKEWYEQFVDKGDQQYFTETELNEIIDGCQNAQDAIIPQLIMDGVLGEASEELLNLRKNDIDFERNILILRDDINKTERKIPVSERCIRLCRQALGETEYEKSNGEASPDTKSLSTKLVDNEYVIKSSLTNTKNLEKAEKNIVHRRLNVLAVFYSKPNLTPKNIQYSGMLLMAKNLYLENGELSTLEYNIIADHFNVPKLNDKEFNLHSYKNEFLNVGKLKEMYDL